MMPPTTVEFARMNLDAQDPNSIYHLVPHSFAERIRNIPDTLWVLSPDELRKQVKPGEALDALKFGFWVEYTRVVTQGKRKMNLANVYGGICHEQYFFGEVCKTPLLLSWVLTPPKNYLNCLQAILSTTISRLYQMVNLDLVNENGKVDHNTARLIVKIHELIDLRLHGGVVQRIEQKNLNVNVNEENLEQLESSLTKKLAELRKREQLIVGETSGSNNGNIEIARPEEETTRDSGS